MAHIFISYKSDDGDFADILKDKLEKAGFTVWIDEQLVPGEDCVCPDGHHDTGCESLGVCDL